MDGLSFYYDFNSPYAYLAAARVDELLPTAPRWQPVALAFLLRAHNRVAWSMREETREPGIRDCEQRAIAYGLPPLRLPPGWPLESYSLSPLRAAYIAADHGLLHEFTRAAFARNFVQGTGLRSLEDLLAAAREAGLDEAAVGEGVENPDVKARLKAATEDALARGVVGVPTVVVGETVFWGDDQLEAAAERMRLAARPG